MVDGGLTARGNGKLLGFISYSREDYNVVRRLRDYLKPLEREFGIEFWSDDRMLAGAGWSAHVQQMLDEADVFVLCMSPAYLSSSFIYHTELPFIAKRARLRQALVFPIVLRPCAWWGYVGDLQAVPTKEGRVVPVSDWKHPNDGLQEAASELSLAMSTRVTPLAEFAWPPEPTDPHSGFHTSGVKLSPGTHHLSDEDIDRAVKAAVARRAASATN